jgi:putative membrane protein
MALNRLGVECFDGTRPPAPVTLPALNLPPVDDGAERAETAHRFAEYRTIRAGRTAWESISKAERETFDNWRLVSAALYCGRSHAMRVACADTPKGARYTKALSHWLEQHFGLKAPSHLWEAAVAGTDAVLALALGLSSVYLRGRALRGRLDREGLKRLFAADNVWGIAAGLWIVTGLLRAFGGLEKGSQFYLQSPLFWIKMALFVAVVVLEIRPMMTFIRWRRAVGRGEVPNTSGARALYLVNHIEMALVVVIVFVASFMARGFGMR